jgi:hypothetical protein
LYGGPTIPHRYPWPTIGGPDNFQKSFGWFNSVADGTPQYGWIAGNVFGGTDNLNLEYTNVDYTLLAGSNIGQPYTVGSEWQYLLHREIWAFDNLAQYLTFDEKRVVTAVGATPPATSIGGPNGGAGYPVGVFAQTFSDCAVIELYRDPDPNTGAAGWGLRQVQWWSATAQGTVYLEEYQFHDMEMFSLSSYDLILA